jgi:hypothetical protein
MRCLTRGEPSEEERRKTEGSDTPVSNSSSSPRRKGKEGRGGRKERTKKTVSRN